MRHYSKVAVTNSCIVANLYMESFEHRAITTAVNPPRIWKRYVDDTFVIQQQSNREEFLQDINSLDPSIILTGEENRPDGSMPSLDTLITPQKYGTLTTSVYTKPTHIDLHLHWGSNDNLACKYSVINSLTYRAKAVCSNPQLLKQELQHLEEVLMKCNYPKWAINKVLQKQEDTRMKTRRNQSTRTNQTEKKCHIVVPYSQGLCESYKTTCSKYGVQVHFKGGNTLKNLLMFPKDKDAITKQNNIIYWFKCGKTECDNEYTGQSARIFEE